MADREDHLSDETARPRRSVEPAGVSLPVLMLTLLGSLIAVLGLFAAGEIVLVIVGLSSVAVAGLVHTFRPSR